MRASRTEKPFVKVSTAQGHSPSLPSGRVYPPGPQIRIETDRYTAAVPTVGYVSGVAAGSFRDKATGATDLGFGLSVVDFLLEPADPKLPVQPGQYHYNDLYHGKIAKRYVEGPQICTQAKELAARVSVGAGFAAVRLSYRWNVAYPPHKAGSVWEQTLIFPAGERFFLSADRVTTVAESPELFFRVDMPGHIKHKGGGPGFEHVYLSYHEPAIIPSTEFSADFPPDAKFLYRRGAGPLPKRFIRGYQVRLASGRSLGPWLAGVTLNPNDVYQAWCHERGYVCMIEELGGRPTKPGDTFGACYLIGWFDNPNEMAAASDRFHGFSGLALEGPAEKPTGFRGLKAGELTPVST
jgi:hypothetical protein